MTNNRGRFQQKPGYVFTSIEEENQRLEELYALEILDSPAAEAFDRITETVAQTFQAPICLITLITEDREWIKSCFGIDKHAENFNSIPREKSFCQHIVAEKQTIIATQTNSRGDLPFGFYAGAPLITENNHVLGTLCIADHEPRDFSNQEIAMLERLAQWTMSEIQLHSRLLAARRRERFLKNFFAITSGKTHSTEKKIEQLMALGCEHFGYQSGGVAILTHDQVGLNPYYGENKEFVIPSFQISEEIFDEVVKREEPIKYIKGQANGSLVYELLKNNFDFDEMIGWRIFNKEEHRQEDTIIFIYMHTSISPNGNPALNQELLMILTQWIGQAYQSRKAHSEILSSEMRYKMVVESANDAIILADENMMIQAWNPAAQKMFQYTKEEALGSKVDIIIPDEFLQKHHTGMERFKKTRQGKIMGRMVELEGRRKDGHCFPIELSLYAWNNEKELFFGCMIRDITERKRDQDIINNLAYRDTLTGLRNRTSFDEKIDWFFEKQRAFRLLFIDIDGFKAVNDTFGHTKGDLLLQAIAERLHSVLRLPEMVPYRYGGDEFLVLINNPEINKFSNIKEEIIEALSFPYYLKGDTIRVSASIGESSYPEHGDDLNKLLKAADTLMYQMKQKGGGRVYIKERERETELL